MVNDIVRMAIATQVTRLPLKVEKIRSELDYHKPRPQEFTRILEKADYILNTIFGMRLVKIPPATKDESSAKTGSKRKAAEIDASQATQNGDSQAAVKKANVLRSDVFIVQSTLPTRYKNLVSYALPRRESIYSGFLITILSLIILRGGSIELSELESLFTQLVGPETFVDQLNFTLPSKPSHHRATIVSSTTAALSGAGGSELFNIQNLDDVLKLMLKQGYIEKETKRGITGGADTREFVNISVGRRAKCEISLPTVLRIVRALLGKENFNENIEKQVRDQCRHSGILEEPTGLLW